MDSGLVPTSAGRKRLTLRLPLAVVNKKLHFFYHNCLKVISWWGILLA